MTVGARLRSGLIVAARRLTIYSDHLKGRRSCCLLLNRLSHLQSCPCFPHILQIGPLAGPILTFNLPGFDGCFTWTLLTQSPPLEPCDDFGLMVGGFSPLRYVDPDTMPSKYRLFNICQAFSQLFLCYLYLTYSKLPQVYVISVCKSLLLLWFVN